MLFISASPFKGIVSKGLRLCPTANILSPTKDLSLMWRHLRSNGESPSCLSSKSVLVSTLEDACLSSSAVSRSLRLSTPLLTCAELKAVCYTDRSERSTFASANSSKTPWLATLQCTPEDFGVVTLEWLQVYWLAHTQHSCHAN